MSDSQAAPARRRFLRRFDEATPEHNRYTMATLERHKRQGLELAVQARWAALAVIAVLLPLLNPRWEVLYYEAWLLVFAGIGYMMRRVGRVGQSRAELAWLFADLALMTFVLVYPNPFAGEDIPAPIGYRFQNFPYFYVLLAAGTLAYTWRTILAFGTWTTGLWMGALLVSWLFYDPVDGWTEAVTDAVGNDRLADLFDPNSFGFQLRIQEVVIFVIVAVILAVSIRRFNALLLSNASLERERANLSRYFSPNVVDELSHNDEPLKQIRTQDVAVMFVDIVGFTHLARNRPPDEVIAILRGFHGRMEAEVFQHRGTLDKYLGDGLMATFGTPVAGDTDATNALNCAEAMLRVMERWNRDRAAAGEPEIQIGIGIHYGAAVLGDIGANRLEFAVIGNTVNVASRLESLSRPLGVPLVISEAMHARVLEEGGDFPENMTRHDGQSLRGLEEPMSVWVPG
ncbi:adenylate/guanylate cyclase domain-containing protein [Shimia biformata]|uniref:adenylate/guanylate cyclase domain-containing protein n=1 Tax=Shimia biformata TaxID=1294299 RepID=UPI001950F9F4|nr:adenylate/guanylate cyclase domain-containing protein [Shimia biformata]